VTEPTCPLCAHLLCDATVVGTRARHGFASRRVVCAGCGLVQVSPQPPVAELDAYYASGQYRRDFANTPIHRGPRQLLPGCAEYEEALDAQAEYRAESLIAAFELETLIAPATLEIGCGEGRTTAALLKRGIAACAVETDATMRVKAAARGVQALADWPAEMPETVALWHVLEHLPAPVEALREIRTRGAKRVFVEVPDVDAYLADREGHHFQHVHLFDFSVSTLASTLFAAGWGDVVVTVHEDVLVAHARVDAPPILLENATARVRALLAEPLAHAPKGQPDTTLLDRWLAGEALADLGADEQALRVELAPLRGHFGALVAAFDDAKRQLEGLRASLMTDGRARVESWSQDPWLRGARFGAGVALDQASQAVSHVVHRMGRMSGAYR